MMYAVNVYAAMYLGVAMFLSGEGVEAVAFMQRHPHVIPRMLLFGATSAIGQVSKVTHDKHTIIQ